MLASNETPIQEVLVGLLFRAKYLLIFSEVPSGNRQEISRSTMRTPSSSPMASSRATRQRRRVRCPRRFLG